MRDQIHFHEAGTKGFLPVGKGADRNHLTHAVGRSRSLLMPSIGSFSDKMKLTIDRGGTHRKQLGPYPPLPIADARAAPWLPPAAAIALSNACPKCGRRLPRARGNHPPLSSNFDESMRPERTVDARQVREYRADAAFAKPEIYEALEALEEQVVEYAIRKPANRAGRRRGGSWRKWSSTSWLQRC
jgi:hypothetical protein